MRNIQLFCAVLFLLHGMTAFAFDGDVVDPVIPDKLERVILDGRELGGEINRRICDLIYKNYMVLDLDKDWIDHFRNREDRHDAIGVYYGVGKVIDAGTLFARYTNDEKVAARTQYLIDEIVKTRDADGYIGFWNREPNDRQNFINWILHEQEYFTLALTRDYRMTGNPESLESAKIMADHIIRTFPKNEEGVYYIPSPISIAGVAEAAVELYRISGDEKYLDFAQNLQYEPHWFYEPFDQWRARINERGFHQYVMLSHLYPETELYRLTGDKTRLLKSDWMRHALLEKDYGALLVTGSSSNGEQFTRDQCGTGNIEESCVTAYLLRFFDSLLRLEGDLRYGDIMERTIYNALFAAQDPLGRRIRYFTAFSGPRVYFPIDTFCCPGNFRRAVAELPQKVYYRIPDGGIAINLYTESKKTFDIRGNKVTVTQKTDYPTNGQVVVSVSVEKPTEFVLRFRTPRWCDKMTAQVNTEPALEIVPKEQKSGGFDICRTWRDGDTLTLNMPMTWRFVKGRIIQEGHVALLRGPVLFCLGGTQNPELVARGVELRELVIDPDSLGEPVPDSTTRPDGVKVTAKAWLNQEAAESDSTEKFDITLTEFPDESGLEVYFRLPSKSTVKPVADELLDEPSTESWETVTMALYGPAESMSVENLLNPKGAVVADLADDYIRPEGKQDRPAVFPVKSGRGQWSISLIRDMNPDSADCEKVTLHSSRNVLATPAGYAYGSGEADGLGFIADHDPSDQQGDEWRLHFTEKLFDSLTSQQKDKRYLYSHPVSDPERFLDIRFTPDENKTDNQGLIISGALLSLGQSNGVTFDVYSTPLKVDRQHLLSFESASGTMVMNGISQKEFFRILNKEEAKAPIDFLIGNNGNYICDSVAISLKIYSYEGASQKDVTDIVRSVVEEQKELNPDDFDRLFGDPAPGQEKTLKVVLKNKITGAVTFREVRKAPVTF